MCLVLSPEHFIERSRLVADTHALVLLAQRAGRQTDVKREEVVEARKVLLEVQVSQLRQRTSAAVNRRAQALIQAQSHPVRTITVDNRTEFHEYAALERADANRFYFAAPRPSSGTR